MSYQGKISFFPIRGDLNTNVRWFGKQSPYIKVRLGDQKKKCKANYDGGKHPTWTREELSLELSSDSWEVQVDCYDSIYIGRDTNLGRGYINVHKLIEQGDSEGVETVAVRDYKDNLTGNIVIDWRFHKDQKILYDYVAPSKKDANIG